MNKQGTGGNFIKDHKFYIFDQFLKNYDVSIVTLYKLVGKWADGLLDEVNSILIKAMRTFVTSNLLVDQSKLGNALRTSILYTQKYLLDNSFLNTYNTGAAVTILLFHNKKVRF
jgi:hypothetical protein